MRQVKCDGCGVVVNDDGESTTESDLTWRRIQIDWLFTRFGAPSKDFKARHACSNECAAKVLAEIPMVTRTK